MEAEAVAEAAADAVDAAVTTRTATTRTATVSNPVTRGLRPPLKSQLAKIRSVKRRKKGPPNSKDKEEAEANRPAKIRVIKERINSPGAIGPRLQNKVHPSIKRSPRGQLTAVDGVQLCLQQRTTREMLTTAPSRPNLHQSLREARMPEAIVEAAVAVVAAVAVALDVAGAKPLEEEVAARSRFARTTLNLTWGRKSMSTSTL